MEWIDNETQGVENKRGKKSVESTGRTHKEWNTDTSSESQESIVEEEVKKRCHKKQCTDTNLRSTERMIIFEALMVNTTITKLNMMGEEDGRKRRRKK